MTKSQLKSEIERLKVNNITLQARCKIYELQEADLATSQREVLSLREKIRDMKNALVKYESIFNFISYWDEKTYNITSVDLEHRTDHIYMRIDLDVVPASIHEDAKQTKGEQR